MKRTDFTIERKAIELYKSGLSVKDIGNKLLINSVTVFNILKRKWVKYCKIINRITREYRDNSLNCE